MRITNVFRTILFPTIILAAAASVGFGQGTTISKSDFESAIGNANQLVRREIRREKSVIQEFSDRKKPANETQSLIEEISPYGSYRSLTKTTKGGKISQYEVIIIDSKYYSRSGNGPWSVHNGGIGGGPSSVPDDIEQAYWKLEKVILDGQKVTLYKSIIKFPKSRYRDDKIPETYTEQYWIANDGRLLKTSRDIDFVRTKKFHSSVTTYEYDPTIKIEAPQMK